MEEMKKNETEEERRIRQELKEYEEWRIRKEKERKERNE